MYLSILKCKVNLTPETLAGEQNPCKVNFTVYFSIKRNTI